MSVYVCSQVKEDVGSSGTGLTSKCKQLSMDSESKLWYCERTASSASHRVIPLLLQPLVGSSCLYHFLWYGLLYMVFPAVDSSIAQSLAHLWDVPMLWVLGGGQMWTFWGWGRFSQWKKNGGLEAYQTLGGDFQASDLVGLFTGGVRVWDLYKEGQRPAREKWWETGICDKKNKKRWVSGSIRKLSVWYECAFIPERATPFLA